ncbi:hypothetical protein KCU95_g13503, partial [Aureobasidium melanogenum]
MDATIEACRTELEQFSLHDPQRRVALKKLIILQMESFNSNRSSDLVDSSIACCKEYLDILPAHDPELKTVPFDLAEMLYLRARLYQDSAEKLAALHQFIEKAQGVVGSSLDNSVVANVLRIRLGMTCFSIWELDATKEDYLDRGLELIKESLPWPAPGDMRLKAHVQYSKYLMMRYRRKRDFSDIDIAVKNMQEILYHSVLDHVKVWLLCLLCQLLLFRYEAQPAVNDLRAVVDHSDRGLKLASDLGDQESTQSLSEYRESALDFLRTRNGTTSAPQATTTDDSMERYERMIKIRSTQVQTEACGDVLIACHDDLSRLFYSKFCISKASSDLSSAMDHSLEALNLASESYPSLADLRVWRARLLACAKSLESSDAGKAKDYLSQACLYLTQAAAQVSVPTIERIRHYNLASIYASELEDLQTTANCLEEAVLLLGKIPRSLSVEDHEFVLRKFSGLSSRAAYVALRGGRKCAHEALALLEAGRGVLSRMLLGLQKDLSELAQHDIELYKEIISVRSLIRTETRVVLPQDMMSAEQLEILQSFNGSKAPITHDGRAIPGLPSHIVGTRRLSSSAPGDDHNCQGNQNGKLVITITEDTPDRGTLEQYDPALAHSLKTDHAARLASLEQKAQDILGSTIPGEKASFSYFSGLASQGPLVSFNVTRATSDVFLVTDKFVRALHLPNLKYEELESYLDILIGPERATTKRNGTKVADRNKLLSELLEWLWDSALKPVLMSLGMMLEQPCEDVRLLPRIWWVGGGKMSFCPFHAAGRAWGKSLENMASHAVSSYATSFEALDASRKRSMEAKVSFSEDMLLVMMPKTTSKEDLDVEEERKILDKTAKEAKGDLKMLVSPSERQVMNALRKCQIAHFACHGISDAKFPSKSCLILGDDAQGNPERMSVTKLASTNFGKPLLIYLSACLTADSAASDLADEALHVASAFNLAGFPHVVSTLWEAENRYAGIVAKQFYTYLLASIKEGHASHAEEDLSGQIARALHCATRDVREGTVLIRKPKIPGRDVLAWAPFLHLGC